MLVDEVVFLLRPRDEGWVIDATVGMGGHAEAILSVDGVDGCWIGPTDLARSMGVDRGAPAHREMILRAVAACQKTGKIPGISGDLDITFWLEHGLRFVTASYDGALVLEGARKVFGILGR